MKIALSRTIIVSFLVIVICSAVLDYFSHTYIKAEFTKTDPMPEKMGVFYKGYRIGSTSKLKISKDFKTTYLYITINQSGLHLPKNISAEVKNYNEDIKFVDIIYPTAPMIKYIETGDVIKGFYELKSDGISDTNQAHLDNLSAKGEKLLSAATETAENLSDLFNLLFDILDENRANLYSSTTALKGSIQNLETTTRNLKDLTNKMNNSLTQEQIKNSTKNFEQITKNLSTTSADISAIPPKINDILDTTQTTMCNIQEITKGLNNTLKQRFGGARIIFGKPVK